MAQPAKACALQIMGEVFLEKFEYANSKEYKKRVQIKGVRNEVDSMLPIQVKNLC